MNTHAHTHTYACAHKHTRAHAYAHTHTLSDEERCIYDFHSNHYLHRGKEVS